MFCRVFFCCHFRSTDAQTKKDKSSNVPKPTTYIAGLRGTGATANKIDITLSDKMGTF